MGIDIEVCLAPAGPPPWEADAGDGPLGPLAGISSRMEEVRRLAQRAASVPAAVFIRGEDGTEREAVARAIHELGPRARAPFVAVDCRAVLSGLVTREIFGRAGNGGAEAGECGLFRAADRGTLFLDQVTALPLSAQARLARVIEEKRRGAEGGEAVPVDVRVIAGAGDPAEGRVDKLLCLDLLYRLNVLVIRLPPLRERRGDVPLLARRAFNRLQRELGTRLAGISARGIERLAAYDWPGNLREMESVIERAMAMASGPVLTEEDLLFDDPGAAAPHPAARADGAADEAGRRRARSPAGRPALVPSLRETERQALFEALLATNGNKSRAARLLGITRQRLLRRIGKLGLDREWGGIRRGRPPREAEPGVVAREP